MCTISLIEKNPFFCRKLKQEKKLAGQEVQTEQVTIRNFPATIFTTTTTTTFDSCFIPGDDHRSNQIPQLQDFGQGVCWLAGSSTIHLLCFVPLAIFFFKQKKILSTSSCISRSGGRQRRTSAANATSARGGKEGKNETATGSCSKGSVSSISLALSLSLHFSVFLKKKICST